jgi:hypothetical protein
MALSNMLNEPRRELIETAVGVVVLGTVGGGDYIFAAWVCQRSKPEYWFSDICFAMVFGLAIAVAIGLLAVGVHALGDTICNALDRRGIQLRPAQRYNRR